MIRKIFSTALVISALSAPAFANEGEHPCAEDAKKLCPGMKFGDGHVMKCLEEHQAQVSPACKAKWAAKKEERKEKRLEKLEERKANIQKKIDEVKKK